MKLSYDLGETVTLTATPFAPNVFIGWAGDLKTGDLISTTNPVTFPMNGNKTVRAKFATPVPLPTGLVAWWRAENNAEDVTGVNNGTLVNNGTPAAEVSFGVGKVGRAFGFHGAAIKALASTTLDVGVGNGLTIEAWIKPADLAHQYPLVEWNDGSRIGTHFWISAAFSGQGGPGCLFANIVDTNQVFHFVISQAGLLNTSDWQHVALTYDKSSGMARLFLNGVNVASANVGSFTPLTTPDLYLGHRLGAAFYSGLMDELTIYNRALTANEIFSIYNADFLGKDFTRPYFTSPSQLPDVALGADYTQQLTTILGTAPVSFSLSAGVLPPGMTLSSAGVVSGVPSTPGTFDFTVLATDAVGMATEQLCVLRVLQPVALPADLIAWWRGEPATGSAVPDIIGGHDGGFFSGNTAAAPVYAAHGKVGSAFAFDGTVYVRIPDAVELRPSEMTAEAWVFPTMQSGDHQSVIARGSSTNEDDIWWLGVFSGKPRFWSKHFGLGMQVLEAPSAIPLNQWTHLAISFDGTTKRLYINGAQVASQGGLGALVYDVAAVPVTIGSDWAFNASTSRFNGRVDEVSLYRRALSSAEVFSLADAGPAGKSTAGPYINSPSQLPFAMAGRAYAQTFTFVRGTAPVGYALAAGSTLPVGLTLTSAGVLSGVPAKDGTFAFVVRATDAAGLFNEQLCRLQVFDSVPAPAGLVGWWRAEGNAQDSAGTNHGTLRNGAGFAAGEVGQAFSLDGTDDCIEIPDAPALRPVSLTLEAWVAFDATSGGRVVFAKPVGTGGSDSYALWLQNGTLSGAGGDTAGIGPILSAPSSLAPGRWYHVAYTFDDGTKQQALYVNGNQVAIGAVIKSIGYDAQPLLLGRDTENGTPNFFLQGRIDEAAIYNRALSVWELGSIYNAGPAGKRPLS